MPPLSKFIYSEKATQFCEISTVDLSYVVPVKSTLEISQNFVAFSECMNFNVKIKRPLFHSREIAMCNLYSSVIQSCQKTCGKKPNFHVMLLAFEKVVTQLCSKSGIFCTFYVSSPILLAKLAKSGT